MEDAELLGYIKNYPEKDALREATRIFRKKSCPPLSSFRRDKDGSTPLHVSIRRGHLEVTKFLLSKGAKLNILNDDGLSPLHVSVMKNFFDISKLLLQKGSDPNLKVLRKKKGNQKMGEQDGLTPLLLLCLNEPTKKLISLLLQNGADPSYIRASNETTAVSILAEKYRQQKKPNYVESAVLLLNCEPQYLANQVLRKSGDDSFWNWCLTYQHDLNDEILPTLRRTIRDGDFIQVGTKLNSSMFKKLPWKLLSHFITKLVCCRCNLKIFPLEIRFLKFLKELDLRENPIKLAHQHLISQMPSSSSSSFLSSFLSASPSSSSSSSPIKQARDFLSDLSASCQAKEKKVLVLGRAASGKSTFLHQLTKDHSPQLIHDTHGITVRQVAQGDTTFHFWDFPGQESFHSRYNVAHQLFFTTNCITILVFNINTQMSILLEDLSFYLSSLAHHTRKERESQKDRDRDRDAEYIRVPYLLIGTHASSLTKTELVKKFQQVCRLMEREFGKPLDVYLVDSNDPNKVPEVFEKMIWGTLLNTKSFLSFEVPRAAEYVHFNFQELKERFESTPPILEWDNAFFETKAYIPNLESETFERSVEYLCKVGEIIKIKTGNQKTGIKKYILLDSSWAASPLGTLLYLQHKKIKNGLVHLTDLRDVFSPDDSEFEIMLSLYRDLDILIPLPSLSGRETTQYLIPHLLPVSQHSHPERDQIDIVLRRAYTFEKGRVSPIDFAHLVAMMLPLGKCIDVWQSGCSVIVSDIGHLQLWRAPFEKDKEAIFFSLHNSTQEGIEVFNEVEIRFVNVFQEVNHLEYSVIIPLNDNCLDWCTLEDAVRSMSQPDKILRSVVHKQEKPASTICPDLIDDFCFLSNSDIQKEKEIGQGSYGTIYLVSICGDSKEEAEKICPGSQYVMKSFTGTSTLQDLLDIRTEALIMQKMIGYPNILKLIGVVLEDRGEMALVVEFMPGKDLMGELTDPKGLYSTLGNLSKKVAVRAWSGEGQMEEELEKTLKIIEEVQKQHPVVSESDYKTLLERAIDRELKEKTKEAHEKLLETIEVIRKWYVDSFQIIAPLTENIFFQIALDIASGLEVLHQNQILHRDLKSCNIMLTMSFAKASVSPPQVLAKIGDFGLSIRQRCRFLQRKRTFRPLGNLNPRFAAPEVLGEQCYTTSMDIFPFGHILWELRNRQISYDECHSKSQDYPFFNEFLEHLIVKGLRPKVSSNDEIDQLMTDCWDVPECRPSAENLRQRIQAIAKKKNLTLFSCYHPVQQPKEKIRSGGLRDSSLNPRKWVAKSENPDMIERKEEEIQCAIFVNSHLWVGYAGKLQVFDVSSFSEERPTPILPSIWRQEKDERILPVNSLAVDEKNSAVWSVKEGGLIEVWSNSPVLLKMMADQMVRIDEMNFAQSPAPFLLQKIFTSFSETKWSLCKVSLYGNHLCVTGSTFIDLRSLSGVSYEEDLNLGNEKKAYLIKCTQKDGSSFFLKTGCENIAKDWFEVLSIHKFLWQDESNQNKEILLCVGREEMKKKIRSLSVTSSSVWGVAGGEIYELRARKNNHHLRLENGGNKMWKIEILRSVSPASEIPVQMSTSSSPESLPHTGFQAPVEVVKTIFNSQTKQYEVWVGDVEGNLVVFDPNKKQQNVIFCWALNKIGDEPLRKSGDVKERVRKARKIKTITNIKGEVWIGDTSGNLIIFDLTEHQVVFCLKWNPTGTEAQRNMRSHLNISMVDLKKEASWEVKQVNINRHKGEINVITEINREIWVGAGSVILRFSPTTRELQSYSESPHFRTIVGFFFDSVAGCVWSLGSSRLLTKWTESPLSPSRLPHPSPLQSSSLSYSPTPFDSPFYHPSPLIPSPSPLSLSPSQSPSQAPSSPSPSSSPSLLSSSGQMF